MGGAQGEGRWTQAMLTSSICTYLCRCCMSSLPPPSSWEQYDFISNEATTSQIAWLITEYICQDKVIFYFLTLRKVLGLRTFSYGLDFEGSKASQDGPLRLWLLPHSLSLHNFGIRISIIPLWVFFSLPPSFAMPFPCWFCCLCKRPIVVGQLLERWTKLVSPHP